jgi:tetratricopeptide (TPR) repeat protein
MRRALAIFKATPAPLEHLNKLIEALAMLGWDGKIWGLYRTSRGEEDLQLALEPLAWFRIGVAAANRGRWNDAQRFWQQALEGDPKLEAPELYLEVASLVREGKAPPFRFPYWLGELPPVEQMDMRHPPEEIKPTVVKAIWTEEMEIRHGAVGLLEEWEDPWAEAFLRLMLIQRGLPDELKKRAAQALVERGAIAQGEPFKIHLDGSIHEVQLFKQEIPLEPSPAAVKLFEQGLSYKAQGDLKQAEEAYRKALEVAPYFPEAMVNLANICRSTDRLDEAERLLEAAVDLGDSPVARLNLAGLYFQRDDPDRALQLLDLLSPEELPDDVRIAYFRLRGYLHIEREELEQARECFQNLVALAPEDAQAQEALRHVELASLFKRRMQTWEKRRRERYLSRPVSSGMALDRALSGLVKANLVGMARWHGLPTSGLRKHELVELIADHLVAHVGETYERLTDKAQQALSWVANKGGSVSFAALVRKFGTTKRDSIDWDVRPPSSAVGELQLAGLLFVGLYGKRRIAVIPQEILERLPH